MSLYPPDVADDVDEPLRSRARVLVMAGIGPLFLGYVSVVVLLALVISVATKSDVSTLSVLSAAMPGWLAAYQTPLSLDGHALGALPLLPTLLMMFFVSRAAGNAADRLEAESARDTVPIIATVTVAHALAGAVLAEVTRSATMTAGVLVPAGVAACAAVIGLAARGYFEDLLERCDELVVHGLRAGLIGLATMVGLGAVLFLLGLSTSFPTVAALFAPGLGDGIGMFLMSVAYLPNAVVGGISFVAGPGVTIGQFTAAPLHFTGGPLPGVPILAALPETGAAWWPILFLLPLAAGAFVGWVLRDVSEDPIARLRAVGAAAVVVAGGCVLLGVGAGGRLADGVFDPLSVHPWSLGLAMLLWIALPAATVAWWAGPRLVLAPSRGLLDDAIEAETDAGAEATDEETADEETADEDSADEDSADDEHAEDENLEDSADDSAEEEGEPDESADPVDQDPADEQEPEQHGGDEPDLPEEIQK
nr:DUF6350 family protein [Kibdelosporangium sp. MJ126-NF4]CEL22318.1 FIG021574: Possible membrane protein related to de Novo purine biosynthesis [Kibdelosporangium sp. MJ126-NF4]CTQ93098.1 FIG021574: Possible membrane protein related to de Novo purine biosynthesis [Kibdelosporangium sp. MJ126-NF4]